MSLNRVNAGISATRGPHKLWWGISHPGQCFLCPAAALSDQEHEWAWPSQLACRELLQEIPLSLQEEYVLISSLHPELLGSNWSCAILLIDCVSFHLRPFISPTGQTCVDIKDNVVNEGYYFTPKGDDPCLSCTCHDGEPEMCVAALCERPQGCQQFRKDPKECCKFTCLDPGTSTSHYLQHCVTWVKCFSVFAIRISLEIKNHHFWPALVSKPWVFKEPHKMELLTNTLLCTDYTVSPNELLFSYLLVSFKDILHFFTHSWQIVK